MTIKELALKIAQLGVKAKVPSCLLLSHPGKLLQVGIGEVLRD
jgi:hypothetical protein